MPKKLIFTLFLLLTACNYPQDPPPSQTPTLGAEALTDTPAPPPSSEGEALADTPTASPTPLIPGKIVFTCQPTQLSGQNQLCLIYPDGSGFRQLTSNLESDHLFASFSPEGRYTLFSSDKSGQYEIWELDLETNQQRPLTDSGFAFAPAVSPDDTRIVYTYNPNEQLGDSQLWLMSRDGYDRYPLTDIPGGAWDPVWSPDGAYILFASFVQGRVQLFTIPATGGIPRQVTDLDGLRGRNDWSIDGLLSTYIGTTWNREIITFDLSGGNPTYLTDGGNNLAPSFSPDGRWIAYTSYIDNYRDDHGCEIYIMRTDGSDRRRLTNNDYCDWQPRWGN